MPEGHEADFNFAAEMGRAGAVRDDWVPWGEPPPPEKKERRGGLLRPAARKIREKVVALFR